VKGTGEDPEAQCECQKTPYMRPWMIIFPELHGIFWVDELQGVMGPPGEVPFSGGCADLKVSALKEMIGRASRRRAEASQKATALYQAARRVLDSGQIGSADRISG